MYSVVEMSERPPSRALSLAGELQLTAVSLPQMLPVSSPNNSTPGVAVRNSFSLSFTLSRDQMETIDEGNQPDFPLDSFTFKDANLWQETFLMLYDFYQSRTFCDIEIHVGSRVLHCHRVVLACFSRYFRSMFLSNMSECSNNLITINDIDENAFNDLVDFAYTSKITMTTENVQTLLYACSILQVDSVAQACCHFMASHLHPANCIGVRNFAEQHGQVELITKAEEFVVDNFVDVVASDEWSQMTSTALLNVISSPNLNVRSEIQVYEAVMKWIRTDFEENKNFVASLMSKVKLPILPADYLMNCVCTEELLKQDLQCRDYLDEAKHYQMLLASVIRDIHLSERMRPRKSYAGVIFCVGGRGASGNPFKTIECYDLRKNQWFQVAEMSTRRRHVGVVAVGGKLYAVGGHDGSEHLKTGEIFDPQTNKWQPIASMSKLRRGIALAHLNGPIYAVGGLDDMACFNIVERYDPESDSWSLVQPMNFSRGGVAVVAYRSCMYAIGGNNGAASLESCERYDPHLNKWSLIQSMNKRRAGAGVAELNGSLYVVGGFDDNSPLDCVEKYDHHNNTWTMVANMSCPRGGVGVAALGGKLYAVGGHDGTNYLSSVEEYDADTDSWTQVANIGTCRAGAGVAVVACQGDDLKDITKIVITGAAGRL